MTTGAVHLRFEVAGEVQLKRRLDGVLANTQDLRPALLRMQEYLESYEERVFAAEGTGSGAGAWSPLSPRYATWKARHYPGAPILTREGDLRRSLTQAGATGAVRSVSARELVFGTSLSVGEWNLGMLHQTGTRRMPARPPLSLSPAAKARLVAILREHLTLDASRG